MLLASDLAIPPPLNALPARLDAWLNLSHLENATVFVIVNINAIAIADRLSATWLPHPAPR